MQHCILLQSWILHGRATDFLCTNYAPNYLTEFSHYLSLVLPPPSFHLLFPSFIQLYQLVPLKQGYIITVLNLDFNGKASSLHHFNAKRNLATGLTKTYFLTMRGYLIPTVWVFIRNRCLIFHEPFSASYFLLWFFNMVNFINRNPKINLSLHSCGETHVPMEFIQWAAGFHLLIMSWGYCMNIQNRPFCSLLCAYSVLWSHFVTLVS